MTHTPDQQRAIAEAAASDDFGWSQQWHDRKKRFRATFDPPTVLALLDRLAALEAERTLPDIGVEPLTLPRPREWDDTLARLRGPMVLQQSGVPRGASLVWRTDLVDMYHRLIRMAALAELRAEKLRWYADYATAENMDVAILRPDCADALAALAKQEPGS